MIVSDSLRTENFFQNLNVQITARERCGRAEKNHVPSFLEVTYHTSDTGEENRQSHLHMGEGNHAR